MTTTDASCDLDEITRSDASSAELRARLERLVETEIAYISNPEFPKRAADDLPNAQALLGSLAASAADPVGLPEHLRRICTVGLLSPREESTLFCEMNYAKFRAARLRSRLPRQSLDADSVSKIEQLLATAATIRNHLIQANTRLVISIVRKFVTPRRSFDELLSDGLLVLMRAIDKFDYGRGYRFSTYAYRSIARDAYRTITADQVDDARFLQDCHQWLNQWPAAEANGVGRGQVAQNMRRKMDALLQVLDRRERFIIRSRYSLGRHRRARTFKFLGNKLGVSKERARQIERRAVKKLHDMASQSNLGELSLTQ